VIVVYCILTATARSDTFPSFLVSQAAQAALFITGQPAYCAALVKSSPLVVPFYRAIADAATTAALAFAGDRPVPRSACPSHACAWGQSALVLAATLVGSVLSRCGGTRNVTVAVAVVFAYSSLVFLTAASALAPCTPTPTLDWRPFMLAAPAAVPPSARARERLSSVVADVAAGVAWLRRAAAG
jgi:hypothetical protein